MTGTFAHAREGRVPFPPADLPVVSVLVALTGWSQRARSCLRTLQLRTHEVPYEVIVAADVDATEAELIRGALAYARVVARDGERRGTAAMAHEAARHATGRYLVVLDEDVEVHDRWLPLLMEAARDRSVGVVGPMVLDRDGRVEAAGHIIWRDATTTAYGAGADPTSSDVTYLKEVDALPACALLVHADVWRAAGGFHQRFAPTHVAAHLAMAARETGFRVIYQPLARVTHIGGPDHLPDLPLSGKDVRAGQRAFRRRWAARLDADHEPRGRRAFRARDRSRARPRVLVCDRHVPEPDRDAGGRAVFQWLALMREHAGLPVTFVAEDFAARRAHTERLEELGIQVLRGAEVEQDIRRWMRAHGPYFDAAWLHRPTAATAFLGLVREHAPLARVVYFAHDLHWLRELRRFEVTGDLEALDASARFRAIEWNVLQQADVVQVVSTDEEALLRRLLPGKPIHRVPLLLVDARARSAPPFGARRDVLFVGNFDHSPNRDGILWFAREVLPAFAEAVPDARLVVVGPRPTAEVRALDGGRVSVLGQVSDADLDRLYETSRVVVAPLRYGAGVKGKVVEAMAAGTPVLTTSAGAEGLSSADDALAVADGAEAFAAQLAQLYRDEDAWTAQAAAAASYVAEHFSRAAALERLRADFGGRCSPVPP